MQNRATEAYVKEILEVQGASAPTAAAIAATLSGQLAAAAVAYDRLPFEAEPAGFFAVLVQEKK